jgi:hypothetical protein
MIFVRLGLKILCGDFGEFMIIFVACESFFRNFNFFVPKAQISNNMKTFVHPFLLSPLILGNCDNSQIYLMQVRCSVGKPQRKKRYLPHLFFLE